MQKIRNLFKHEEGFTLIELLVVIAVLGILAAIAIPRLSGITERARENSLRASGQTVRSSVELTIADIGRVPTVDTLEDPAFDYYVNIDDNHTLAGETTEDFTDDDDLTFSNDINDSYSYTVTDEQGWEITIEPGGVSLTASP